MQGRSKMPLLNSDRLLNFNCIVELKKKLDFTALNLDLTEQNAREINVS